MAVISMKTFGIVLTGRLYGVNAAAKIMSENSPPFIFDFKDVITMGSSFGDEIFKAAIKVGDGKVSVVNANKVVVAALGQIEADLKTELTYL